MGRFEAASCPLFPQKIPGRKLFLSTFLEIRPFTDGGRFIFQKTDRSTSCRAPFSRNPTVARLAVLHFPETGRGTPCHASFSRNPTVACLSTLHFLESRPWNALPHSIFQKSVHGRPRRDSFSRNPSTQSVVIGAVTRFPI